MNNSVRNVLFTGLIVFLISSCKFNSKYEDNEAEEIQNFLADHPELDFVLKQSGLYYLDVEIGTGNQPETSDTVFVYYSGYFLDGTEFESNVDSGEPYGFPAGEGWVIPGFDEGVMYMREGGTAKFLIPSALAYGNSGYYMPAYTPLLFEVMLDSLIAGPGGR